MNNPRNLFIVGFALYMGLSVPAYFTQFAAGNEEGRSPVNTGSTTVRPARSPPFTLRFSFAAVGGLNDSSFSSKTVTSNAWQQRIAGIEISRKVVTRQGRSGYWKHNGASCAVSSF
jgi:hypothetical protein